MISIHIKASKEYDVLVERGLLDRLGPLTVETLGKATCVIVSDDTVHALYGHRAKASLEAAGCRVLEFVFPHGEEHKTLATYGALLNFLCEKRLTRSDLIIALGGGVVGDLAGFAAATYQRGIRFVQVPTTLLAMVDSSVGGKTAVDLDAGKNQAGAFHQPSLVLCDPELLETLPEEEYRCGCAEIIKYGMLGDREFFDSLRKTPVREQLERVIAHCVAMKRDIVAADEYDRGLRQKLNLGHSIGHAVEACSNYTLLHGQAVAIGMAVITRAAVVLGHCDGESLAALLDMLDFYGLPNTTDYPVEALFSAAMADKKLSGETMHLIVPERVGSCRIESIPASSVGDWMIAGGLK